MEGNFAKSIVDTLTSHATSTSTSIPCLSLEALPTWCLCFQSVHALLTMIITGVTGHRPPPPPGSGGRVIVITRYSSTECHTSLPKTPSSTLGGATPRSPILSDSSSPALAPPCVGYTTPCSPHSSLTGIKAEMAKFKRTWSDDTHR